MVLQHTWILSGIICAKMADGQVHATDDAVVQANLSYGGVKSSGLGKEASLEAMLEHFTHKKTLMVNMG
jgi:aldehyde dehydrogenase (NAD+)